MAGSDGTRKAAARPMPFDEEDIEMVKIVQARTLFVQRDVVKMCLKLGVKATEGFQAKSPQQLADEIVGVS